MLNIKGSIVALVTPFHSDGSVNFPQLEKLIDWHIENHTDAILILGTTGESSTMSHEEDDEVCRVTLERVAGRVPVIVGSGSNSTETQLMKSMKYADMGADAVLCISPYYVKANAEGMYHHFADVADQISCPVILYNVPGRTGCSIPVEVVERLSKHPNIAGIKEASGDMAYAAKVARYLSDDFQMWCGNDDITVPMMAIGASGTISVWANIMPQTCHDMVMDFLNGDVKKAAETQLKYLDLINKLFIEVNPIPVKEAMNMMGMNAGAFRLPLYPMADSNRETLRKSMQAAGLL